MLKCVSFLRFLRFTPSLRSSSLSLFLFAIRNRSAECVFGALVGHRTRRRCVLIQLREYYCY